MAEQITSEQRDRFALTALYETSRLLSASLDLDFILDNLLLTAMSKLLVARGVALLIEPVEGVYRVASAKGLRALEPGDDIPIDASLQGLSHESLQTLTDEEIPEPLRRHGIALVHPIYSGDRALGLIGLGRKATGEAFEPSELEFLQSLVQMSAAAVHNSLMVRELRQANRDLDNKIQQLNTLFDLSQEFNATIDREWLVKLLSFALMGQMLVQHFGFLLRRTTAEDETWETIALRGLTGERFTPELKDRLGACSELVMIEPDDEDWPELAASNLRLILPLRLQGETMGVLLIGEKKTGEDYAPDDVEFIYALGNLALTALRNSYLIEEQIEKERLEKEIALARQIQEQLLPRPVPTFEGMDVAAVALPSREVGGDYFDVIALDENRLLLAVADVTGKGVPASLLMANLQACLQVLVPMDISLEDAVAQINRVMVRNTQASTFITFFCGIYHRGERRLDYINAGHNPPVVVRPDGSLEYLKEGGLLLGVMNNVRYDRGSVTLHPGEVVALFTDGVTEAMSADGEEFGEERLEACLRESRENSAEEILNDVREELRRFSADPRTLSDDLTMVVVKVQE